MTSEQAPDLPEAVCHAAWSIYGLHELLLDGATGSCSPVERAYSMRSHIYFLNCAPQAGQDKIYAGVCAVMMLTRWLLCMSPGLSGPCGRAAMMAVGGHANGNHHSSGISSCLLSNLKRCHLAACIIRACRRTCQLASTMMAPMVQQLQAGSA